MPKISQVCPLYYAAIYQAVGLTAMNALSHEFIEPSLKKSSHCIVCNSMILREHGTIDDLQAKITVRVRTDGILRGFIEFLT